MVTLLKNEYSPAFVVQLGNEIAKAYPPFQVNLFVGAVVDNKWEARELKERMHHLAAVLQQYLPTNYRKALEILKPVSLHFSGLPHMVFPDFVEQFGLEDYEASINALAFFTTNSSSEFAIRPFIIRYPILTMAKMREWATSSNEHIRRLASEGCRPRLPWAMALPDFKKDPTAVIEVIKQLKNDESLYVRRSVANNLNDIAKDNPQVVKEIAAQWIGHTPETDWLVKHACRTLLKQGDVEVLALFGFMPPQHIELQNINYSEKVRWGGELNFAFDLVTRTQEKLGKLRLEFAIDFMKANGKTSRKVFQISEGEVNQTSKSVQKQFSFRPISTRKYYAGIHEIRFIINGEEMYANTFSLEEKEV